MPASPVLRVLAGIGGVIVLLIAGLTSFGMAIIAPLAIGIAAYKKRRRGEQLSLFGSWLVGAGVTAMVTTIALGLAFTFVPELNWDRLQQQALEAPRDTSEFERMMHEMTPPSSPQADSVSKRILESPTFWRSWGVFTVAFTGILWGLLFGTIAWGGTALVSYAFTGKAPGRAPVGESGY